MRPAPVNSSFPRIPAQSPKKKCDRRLPRAWREPRGLQWLRPRKEEIRPQKTRSRSATNNRRPKCQAASANLAKWNERRSGRQSLPTASSSRPSPREPALILISLSWCPSRVPPKSPQFPVKPSFRVSKLCVCNARRRSAVRLLTESLFRNQALSLRVTTRL